MKTVLVTGAGGYIGSVLVPVLLHKGYRIKAFDRFFFGVESLNDVLSHPCLEIIRDDIRWFDPHILKGVDIVIDLAALSNDPSGELDPAKTLEINYRGRERVAKLSKEHGVHRYVLASSCSVYGFREDMVLDEKSSTHPLTTYAKANLLAEEHVLALHDSGFVVTVFRQATAYGLSPRMRFDLAINGMVLGFFKNGKIPVLRDGNQWRPFVHVRDIAQAFLLALEADDQHINGEIFNVGSNDQNYQILPLAQEVAEAISVPFQMEWYGLPDHRSYRVNFDKIQKVLGFKAHHTPRDGAVEVYRALGEGRVTDSAKTKTVEWYKQLIYWNSVIKEVAVHGVIL